MSSTSRSSSPRVRRPRRSVGSRRADLSHPPDHHDHPVRCRRPDRRARPHGRAEDERSARPTGHHRECRRRRRHDRRPAGRAAPRGRLHHRARHRRHPRPEPDALQAPALQRGDGLHAGCADRGDPDGADRAQGPAGQQPQGIRRVRQEEPGQDELRLGGHRLGDPSRLHRARRRDGNAHHPRALSRHRVRRWATCRPGASTISATS